MPDNTAPEEEARQAVLEEPEGMGMVAEIWAFLRVRKKFWLAPIIIALMLLGLLIVFAGQAGVVSPFVYML